jgi:Sortase domain
MMSSHDTPGTPGRPGRQSRVSRRRLLAGVVPAVLLIAGGALLAMGLPGHSGGPHPQPLPARDFALAPAAALALPAPGQLASPQPGSIQATCKRLRGGRPQIAIPSLCIYAPLVAARVAGGTLVIPPDVHLAGLDTGSAALTARHGTTIIAGHVDNLSQGDGVFYFLYRIRPGAVISVTDSRRNQTIWRVYRVVTVHKNALPGEIWNTIGPRRLVLVTCGGPIERTRDGNSYADNVLVYATRAVTRR